MPDDDDDRIDDQMRRLKTGLDATEHWSLQAQRIADSFEHFSLAQTLMHLSAMGLRAGQIPPFRHYAGCPSCAAIKGATQAPIVPANGNLIKKG